MVKSSFYRMLIVFCLFSVGAKADPFEVFMKVYAVAGPPNDGYTSVEVYVGGCDIIHSDSGGGTCTMDFDYFGGESDYRFVWGDKYNGGVCYVSLTQSKLGAGYAHVALTSETTGSSCDRLLEDYPLGSGQVIQFHAGPASGY